MTEYSHESWIAQLTSRTALLTGDENALDAIRAMTKQHHRAADITPDAPVFLWHGLYVKGLGSMQYEVPDHVRSRYVTVRAFPQDPIATMPIEPEPSSTQRDALLQASQPAEGSPDAIHEAKLRTRLFHEVDEDSFPYDGELRWFANGLHVVGPGDDPVVYQTPMSRMDDMVVARQAPQLPYLRAPRREP